MSRQNFIDSWFSLQICVEGYKWSHPFSVDSEGLIHIILRREHDDAQLVIRAEVRNGVKGSRYLVVFRLASRQSPYRLSTILCS
jgi:vacuolar protein sorting-associated protein 13A/C